MSSILFYFYKEGKKLIKFREIIPISTIFNLRPRRKGIAQDMNMEGFFMGFPCLHANAIIELTFKLIDDSLVLSYQFPGFALPRSYLLVTSSPQDGEMQINEQTNPTQVLW